MSLIFRHEFTVREDALDRYGHVNNVVYVQWMQDIAVLHSDTEGWTEATHSVGAAWVARTHKIEYLRPTFAGDRVAGMTWISALSSVTSLRKYRFVRTSDNAVLAKGETEWVFVDARTGRPMLVPKELLESYKVLEDKKGP